MAKTTLDIVNALRTASKRIKTEGNYQWGHMGACNCGYVAQEITKLSKGEIHQYAMKGYGDWTEQVEAFCPTSDFPMDLLISEMIAAGFSLEDLVNLERLKDREVLKRISSDKRMNLRHNNAGDVALYLDTWADLLEEKMDISKTTELTLM